MKRPVLHDSALPACVHENKMWDYYRRGLDEWFLVWGNNVFSYDRAVPARHLGPLPLSLEQLGSIAVGVYPGIKILETETNGSKVRALERLRVHLILVGLASLIALIVLLSAITHLIKYRSASLRSKP